MARTVFVGRPYQRGGVGGIFGALTRTLMPLAKAGIKEGVSALKTHGPTIAKSLGKEAAKTGMSALAEVAAGKGVKSTIKKISKSEKDKLARKIYAQLAKAQGGGKRAVKAKKKRQKSTKTNKKRRGKRTKKAKGKRKKKTKRQSAKKNLSDLMSAYM